MCVDFGLVSATTQASDTAAIGLEILSAHSKLTSSRHIQETKSSLVIREPGLGYLGHPMAMASPYMWAQLALALPASRCPSLSERAPMASDMQEVFRDAMGL